MSGVRCCDKQSLMLLGKNDDVPYVKVKAVQRSNIMCADG
jgi:hypothetical protein